MYVKDGDVLHLDNTKDLVLDAHGQRLELSLTAMLARIESLETQVATMQTKLSRAVTYGRMLVNISSHRP